MSMKSISAVVLSLLAVAAPVSAQQRVFPLYTEALPVCAVGTIVNLGDIDPLVMQAIEVDRRDTGGLFVYSGSPEYALEPAITYQDSFRAGDTVRVYVYHANRAPIPLRFSIVLEPLSGPAAVDKINNVITTPSRDYFGIGRLSAFIQLCRPTPPQPLRLNVDGPTILDKDLDAMVAIPGKPEFLIHTIHEFRVVSGAVRMSVVGVEADADTIQRLPSLKIADRDKNHDRATVNGLTREITAKAPYRTSDGPRHLRLQDGVGDPWMTGRDATLDREQNYRGAYGVVFKMKFRLESPDGRHVALLLNPRAGALTGAVVEESLWKTQTGGLKTVRSASHAPSIGQGLIKEKTEGVVLGKWNPAITPEVTVYWTPPATSSTPVEMILVPYTAP